MLFGCSSFVLYRWIWPRQRRSVEALADCMKRLRKPYSDNLPWLAVYGDSLSRGIFFDTIEALNGSDAARHRSDKLHPGHNANYSDDCTILESRPPLNRKKCGGFAFDFRWPAHPNYPPPIRAAVLETADERSTGYSTHPDALTIGARLSFRLKTFSWEPDYDEAWLSALSRSPRLPDALLLSFGIWDMQYPPGYSAGNPEAIAGSNSLEAFESALKRFLAALERVIEGHGKRERPRLYWLSVTAVADEKLPAWKRPRMSNALARKFNKAALPHLRRHKIEYIDTYTSGAAHPELSLDGVHFGGRVSREQSDLFWSALCSESGEPVDRNQ